MEAVWPTWAIYRCPQRGICSLMGPSEIELIGSILLLQRLTASINLWFLPKATSYRRHIAWGSHQASEKVKRKSLSRVWLFATPWTAAHQAPPSMGFSRQEYWSGVPLPSPSRVWVLFIEWRDHIWFLFSTGSTKVTRAHHGQYKISDIKSDLGN